MAITTLLIARGFCPKLIKKGRNIILLELEDFAIRFICSNNYISGNEFELAKQLNVYSERSFFPKSFISENNFNYEGPLPISYFYLNFEDKFKDCFDLEIFIANQVESTWNFQYELKKYFFNKLQLLIKCMLKFLNESFTFQFQLAESLKLEMQNLIHPFNSPVCSLSGYIFSVYKVFYLNSYPIFSINKEYGQNHKQVSLLEYKYCSLMNYLYPEKKFIYAFQNPRGPKFFL